MAGPALSNDLLVPIDSRVNYSIVRGPLFAVLAFPDHFPETVLSGTRTLTRQQVALLDLWNAERQQIIDSASTN